MDMFIQTHETPNPQTLKFIPGVVVLPVGSIVFDKNSKKGESNLADLLLQIEGVESLFFAEDFISVTKNEKNDWEDLKPLILPTMIDYFLSGQPVININSKSNSRKLDNAIANQIQEIIETRVQPAVAQDGGNIIFKEFTEGVVYVELQGACSGCPSSTITLKNGIENMLKHYVPEVISVEAI